MPEIPTRPELIRSKKVNVKQDTSTGSNIAPKASFSMPYVGGDAAIKVVDSISTLANNVADADAKDKAFKVGQERELEANKKGETTIQDKLQPSWTISGAAYENGQNTAFLHNKEIEISTNMDLWRTKFKLDPEGYVEATKEYEAELLGSLPEKMQNPVFMAYEKQKAAVGAEIQGNIIDQNRATALNKAEYVIDRSANTARLAILTGDENALALMEAAKAKIEIDLVSHSPTADYLNLQRNAFRLDMLDALLEAEWKRVEGDPKARDALIKKIENGSWKGDLDTKDLSKVFPRGMDLTLTEQEQLKKKITALNKNFGTANTSLKSDAMAEATEAYASNASGNTIKKQIFTDANYQTTERSDINNPSQDTDHSTFVRWQSEHDKEKIRSKLERSGATELELQIFDQKWSESVAVGTSAYQSYVLGRGTAEATQEAIILKETEKYLETIVVGKTKDKNGKVIFKTQEQKDNSIKIQKLKIDAFSNAQNELATLLDDNGNNAVQALISKGIINWDPTTDNTKAGLDQLKKDVASTLNIQVDMINVMPQKLVNDFKTGLSNAENGEAQVSFINQAYMQYGQDNTYQIMQKLVEQSEKVEDDVLLALLAVHGPGREFTSVQLGDATKAYTNNIKEMSSYKSELEAYDADLTADNMEKILTIMTEAEFSDDSKYGFTKGSWSTAQTQSMMAMHKTMLAKFIVSTRGDIGRAIELTDKYIAANFVELELAPGQITFASLNDVPNQAAADEYKLFHLEVAKDPLAYGGVSANLDTVDDLQSNFPDFTVSLVNGKLTYYDEAGTPVMLSQITQAGDSMYSEFSIKPYSKVKGNVPISAQLQNQADYIEYSHTGFTNKFKVLKEVSWVDEANVTQVDMREKTLNEKVIEANEEFKNKIQDMETAGGKQAGPQSYIKPEESLANETVMALKKGDFATRELTNDPKEQDILVMVSHAVSTGDMQPWMLEWIGNNIPYGKKAQYGMNRKEIMDLLNDPEKHALFKGGLVDKGNTGSTQTPLQYLFTIIREQPDNPYRQFDAPDIGVEFEITGS